MDIELHNLRDFSTDKHRKVDDYPYGGEAGMVLTPQPIFDCIESLNAERTYDAVIYTAPDGVPFTQEHANRLSLSTNLLFLCGHYKGVDQRVRDQLITHEFNLGDFVVSGGELPVMMIVDSIVRLLPGVLGDAESALNDSFQNRLLEGPVYTRPQSFRGLDVPDVLVSGHQKKIEEWKMEQSIKRTKQQRSDLFNKFENET